MDSTNKRRLGSGALIVLLLALDLASKALAEAFLSGRGRVEILGDFLILIYSENHGAFLSLGAGMDGIVWTLLFLILPAAVVIGMGVYLFVKEKGLAASVSLSLVVAGGLGNLADRLFRGGFVRDFINAGIGDRFRTGILNLADLWLTAGLIAFLVVRYLEERRERAK